MTAVAPLPILNNQSLDIGRPGQQLLPGYAVKLLKTLKIPFGTDRTMNGVDVDPTINLVSHIIECLGALRDVNKVYRAKGSLASRSVGTRVMFGFTAELGNILLDAVTFEPPADLSDSSLYYAQIASSILSVFPEIAAQVTPSTGKVLLHHIALKASRSMAMDALKMVVKAFPAGAWTADRTGAIPLHWITHNPNCTQEMVNQLISANPKGPWVADVEGYLPLHWAVNQDKPNIDVITALITANASASAKACMKGSLPLHWCVNRDNPHVGVLRALLQVHADAVRTFDKTGWLPIHQCVNRSEVGIDALQLLIELYPQGLQCPNVNGQLPLHRALDQTNPHLECVQMLLEAFPGGAKVADDEGYLPLHLALDCARPSPPISKMLLDFYPEAAFHKSKDGLLPIHCIISSMNPVIEIIQHLIHIFPESSESMAVDVIPVDEKADPENWQGEWIEKRWTPLSRAIDRGLDAIVILFRDALNNKYTNGPAHGGPPMRTSGSPSGTGLVGSAPIHQPNTNTPKTLQPQSRPPINSAAHQNILNSQNMDNNGSHLVLGGNLDEEEIAQVTQQQQPGSDLRAGPSSDGLATPMQTNLAVTKEMMLQQSDGEGLPKRGPIQLSRPGTGNMGSPGNPIQAFGPNNGSSPSLKERAPGGSVVHRAPGGSVTGRKESRRRDRGDRSESRHRHREHRHHDDKDYRDSRDRHSSRDRRDRDRSSDRRRHKDRGSSRDHREHRSKDRRADRSSSRHRDRHYYDDEEMDDDEAAYESRAIPPSRGGQRGSRNYEQTEYDDDPDFRDFQGDEPPFDEGDRRGNPKTRLMSAGGNHPKDAPPKSLLDAANKPIRANTQSKDELEHEQNLTVDEIV